MSMHIVGCSNRVWLGETYAKSWWCRLCRCILTCAMTDAPIKIGLQWFGKLLVP